jgi:hypothetical protein
VNERDEANVKKLLSLNPRKVGVYKPLFGAAFHDIIGTISRKTFNRVMMIDGMVMMVVDDDDDANGNGNGNGVVAGDFSHWAWGDIDTLIGDVAGLVSAKDLREFDIISFNTGSGLLYLQGQLTILANRPEVNDAWKVQIAIVFIIFIIVFMSIVRDCSTEAICECQERTERCEPDVGQAGLRVGGDQVLDVGPLQQQPARQIDASSGAPQLSFISINHIAFHIIGPCLTPPITPRS